jgi:hypothetical protein
VLAPLVALNEVRGFPIPRISSTLRHHSTIGEVTTGFQAWLLASLLGRLSDQKAMPKADQKRPRKPVVTSPNALIKDLSS